MKIKYTYEEFTKDYKILSNQIKSFNPDALLLIARGGLTIGHFISEYLNIREVFSLNSISYEKDKKLDSVDVFNIPDLTQYKKIVLLDDISDSGDTLNVVISKIKSIYPDIDIKTATIFYKSSSLHIPDFTLKKTDKWIEFFWEID